MPDRVKGLTEIQGNNYNIPVNSEEINALLIVLRRVINAAVEEPVGLKAY